jgi:hypothetical protein
MEIRQLVNNPLTKLFNFDYPFYVEQSEIKAEFEELFINRYYFHEIGAETFERWEQMLKARLMVIMPYYAQLYQTQWDVVKKDMMQSKDLTETTTRILSSTSDETKAISSNVSDQSEGTTSGTGTGSSKESSLTDGVAVVGVDGDLTSESSNQTSSTATSSSESTVTSSGNETSSGMNELEETITFESKGDIGIQTPAYAITEWRKVIININEMIINDCRDLFMQIY